MFLQLGAAWIRCSTAKLIAVTSALKFVQILPVGLEIEVDQQYLNSTQSPWKNILEEMLKSVGGPNLIIHYTAILVLKNYVKRFHHFILKFYSPGNDLN
jgi:hypothetical protein